MTAAPALSVVMVTYRSADHVPGSIAAVRAAATGLDVELVVVDNGSTDGTVEVVRSVDPDAVVLSGHGNVGFAKGCNLGAHQARADLVLFLNPDTELRPGALRALLDAVAAHPRAGLWGGRTLRPDGRGEHTCAAGAMTPWSLLCFATGLSSAFPRHRWLDPESLGSWERDTPREVPSLSGAVLLVSREAWDRLGGFDERYFMYAEDADLCQRAWQAGYRPRLVPDAEAVHEVGASSDPGSKQVLLHRGKATYVRLRWTPATRWFGLLCLWLGVGLRGRLAERLQPRGDARRRTAPTAWTVAWERRREWLAGW